MSFPLRSGTGAKLGTNGKRRNEVLIAAQSGRALAQAALRVGYVPLVVDLFADDDTSETAAAVCEIPALRQSELIAALKALAANREPVGVVLGSGFEDRPALVEALQERFRIIGNHATAISYVKDSVAFAAACAALGVPHPAVRLDVPGGPDWLLKQEGGSGGFHVRHADPNAAKTGWYFQRQVSGEPAGVLFVADGRGGARVIAITDQWTDSESDRPFRFGGAVYPSAVSMSLREELDRAVWALSEHFGLCGLNSLDVLVREDGYTALEINPRPGATIDLFPDWPLFAWHVAGWSRRLPEVASPPPGARAMALAYATRDLEFEDEIAWPDWTADRTRRGNRIAAGEPFCSVHGEAATGPEARALVEARLAEIRDLIERP